MKVVDTSVWSRVWRRPATPRPNPAAELVASWVRDNVAVGVPGLVLQELLSGVRNSIQAARLADELSAYPLLLATRDTHLAAARIVNHCRAAGVQVTAADALIAATSEGVGGELVTCDRDFEHLARVYPLRARVLTDG